MTDQTPAARPQFTSRRVLILVAFSAAVALAITLGIGNLMPAQARQCDPQVVAGQKLDAAATGQLAALVGTGEGRGYADMAFKDNAGRDMTIADFAGRKLLVNFWASWCIPCRAEMPALDALATKYNSDGFEVLPINLDIGEGGQEKAQAFLDEGAFQHLPLYADATFSAFERLKREAVAVGLPVTLLLDDKGCELAILPGPAEWDTPDGHRVIEALIEG